MLIKDALKSANTYGIPAQRCAAPLRFFGISKSTVHIDVTKRLYDIDRILYDQVKAVLEINKAQRHIRGGNATKEKYSKMKQNK